MKSIVNGYLITEIDNKINYNFEKKDVFLKLVNNNKSFIFILPEALINYYYFEGKIVIRCNKIITNNRTFEGSYKFFLFEEFNVVRVINSTDFNFKINHDTTFIIYKNIVINHYGNFDHLNKINNYFVGVILKDLN